MNDHQQQQQQHQQQQAAARMASYPQGYAHYQQQPQQQQRQTTQAQSATPQQPAMRSTPYAQTGYSYDQASQMYAYQPAATSASSQQQPQQSQQQYPQPMYQSQLPQQYSSSAAGSSIPQYQAPYVSSGYQMQQPAYQQQQQQPQSSGYAFPPYGVPQVASTAAGQDTNSPYKPQTQLNVQGQQMQPLPMGSGGNINMAHIRGPLQSATQPPIIDPNQVPQRPKLTTTFWEDESTVCYQVEARGISVSRREDTNFINGTKLLNVAGMTRGRRDGILKSEKVRYVVKIGAMNLKGVWIPFERALELARNEGIVDLLYPLFVKDIKELYQGPQYSGGLTAAANSNPKNIIPVTVTNSLYASAIYPPKKDKTATAASSTPNPEPQSSVPPSGPADAQHTQQQQYQYGGAYPTYPYQQDSFYNKSYYGYPPAGPTETMPAPPGDSEKSPDQK